MSFRSHTTQGGPRRNTRMAASGTFQGPTFPPMHQPPNPLLFLPVTGPTVAVPQQPMAPMLARVPIMRPGGDHGVVQRASALPSPPMFRQPTASPRPANLNRNLPIFRAPVPTAYPLCEMGRIHFTSGNEPGVRVSECIRTNYSNLDNGHIAVKCFEPYSRIPWVLMWPGYPSSETHVIDMRRMNGPVTLRALARYICDALCMLQRQKQVAYGNPKDKRWALGTAANTVRLDQIWLVAFGLADSEHGDLWIPEFEVTSSTLPRVEYARSQG